jgi:hypothetical protein
MALTTNITGLTGTQADVDTNNNLKVVPTGTLTGSPFGVLAGEISSATEPAGLIRKRNWVSAEGRQHMAVDRPVLYVNFSSSATPANALPQDVFKQVATTMTFNAGSGAGGFLQLNASAITSTTTGIQFQSYAAWPTYGGYGTIYEWEAKTINVNGTANKVVELGVGLTTDAKTAGLLDGFCFRWTATNTFVGVMSINGSEFTTANLTIPSDNVVHRYTIRANQDGLYFFVDSVLQAVLQVPADQSGPGYQPNLPVLMRLYNTASAPSLAAQLNVAEMWVTQGGLDWNKPWSHVMAGMSQHSSNVPYGQAVGQTPALANSSDPAAAAVSNTAALVTGLGGNFQANIAVAAATDYIITSYLVPAQSATQASKRLHITGIRINAYLGTAAAVASVWHQLRWYVAWGHTAVSLATADGIAAKAPRRMSLGQMALLTPATVLAGQPFDRDINLAFSTPIVVNPGEYVASVVRFGGGATAAGVYSGAVSFEGYWE